MTRSIFQLEVTLALVAAATGACAPPESSFGAGADGAGSDAAQGWPGLSELESHAEATAARCPFPEPFTSDAVYSAGGVYHDVDCMAAIEADLNVEGDTFPEDDNVAYVVHDTLLRAGLELLGRDLGTVDELHQADPDFVRTPVIEALEAISEELEEDRVGFLLYDLVMSMVSSIKYGGLAADDDDGIAAGASISFSSGRMTLYYSGHGRIWTQGSLLHEAAHVFTQRHHVQCPDDTYPLSQYGKNCDEDWWGSLAYQGTVAALVRDHIPDQEADAVYIEDSCLDVLEYVSLLILED